MYLQKIGRLMADAEWKERRLNFGTEYGNPYGSEQKSAVIDGNEPAPSPTSPSPHP